LKLNKILTFFIAGMLISISPVYPQGTQPKPLENVLTLVLTFGAANMPEDYLLAWDSSKSNHQNFAVDTLNNMYVFDEYKVKIFDAEGKSKAIWGKQGQGPGEFDGSSAGKYITISPTGFITISKGDYYGKSNGYTVYNSQYKFVTDISDRSLTSRSAYTNKTYSFNDNEYICVTITENRTDNIIYQTSNLEYNKNNNSTIIALFTKPKEYIGEYQYISSDIFGKLYYDLLPGRKVIFTFSRTDEIADESGNYYVFHTYNLDSGEQKQFKIKCTPVILNPNSIAYSLGSNFPREMSESARDSASVRLRLEYFDYLKKNNINTKEAVQDIFFDGKILYIKTPLRKTTGDKENLRDMILFDVIDAEKGELINSVYLPDGFLEIKNGYLYNSGLLKKKYIVIEKYKIDPKVYQK